MKAAVFYGARDIRIGSVAIPVPRSDELLLKVHACGICGTDADEWAHGPLLYAAKPERHSVTGHSGPLVPGHELAGYVIERGSDVRGFADESLVACGGGSARADDLLTDSGLPHLSPSYATVGLQTNGGFAQFCAVPARACLAVKELQPDAAVLAQPMAIAVHALRRSRLRSGETAAVIGVGGIGAFIVAAAARLGATVLAFDTNPGRAVIAKRLGAHDAIVPEPSTTPGHVTPPNVVFEASGTAGGWDLAIAMAGASSRLVIVGLQNERREVDLRAASQRELELIGTNAHRGTGDLDEALMVLASREIGWSDVAPRAVPLSEIVERGILPLLEHRATVIKTLVDPWANASRATATSSG